MFALGHRGAPEVHFENTLAGFQAAVDLGADGVELDVRRTIDGRWVVHHDACPPGSKTAIGRTPMAIIERLRLPDGSAIPTLQQALEALRGAARVVVEIKGSTSARGIESVIHLSRDHGVTLSSFNHPMLARLADASIPLALTMDRIQEEPVAKATRLGASELHLWHPLWTRERVRRARQRGILTVAWTVDRIDDLRRLAALGVEGVITNRLETVLDYLRRNELLQEGPA